MMEELAIAREDHEKREIELHTQLEDRTDKITKSKDEIYSLKLLQ